jgi:hypothetical protein
MTGTAKSTKSNMMHRLGGVAPCPGHVVQHLNPSQLAALHAFKHEVTASGFRLYQEVPAEHADPVIEHFLKTLIA